MADDDRFWSLADQSGDCWTWSGTRRKDGYGLFWAGGRQVRAHRHAYELANGPIAPNLSVLHSCDNRPCVRPDHLRVGTQRDNMADLTERGHRFSPFRGQVQIGSRNRYARLTEADIPAIRARLAKGERHDDIAADYRVHRATISQVARGFTWTHVK